METLPDSVLYHIFSNFTCTREIIRLGSVCKQWHRVASTPQNIKQLIVIPRYWDSWVKWVDSTKTTFDKLIILDGGGADARSSEIFPIPANSPKIFAKTVIVYNCPSLPLNNLLCLFPETTNFKINGCVLVDYHRLKPSPQPINIIICGDTHLDCWRKTPRPIPTFLLQNILVTQPMP